MVRCVLIGGQLRCELVLANGGDAHMMLPCCGLRRLRAGLEQVVG
jgi:hypothetical protein